MLGRKYRPVVIMGCPRSGTNLLHDILVSAGGFAVYRGRLPVYHVLIPRFGKLDRSENRAKLMAAWVHTEGFRRTQLDPQELTAKVMDECRCGGDFLRIVMQQIAQKQNASRWIIYSPEMLLLIPIVRKEIPDALFLHIIRDGRDVALSLRKLGGFNPLPWQQNTRSLQETALYWKWLVKKGRRYGREIADDYMEVHFEDLIGDPGRTLARLSKFLDHPLDLDQIRDSALGTVKNSNSAFQEEISGSTFEPVQRWKRKLTEKEVAALQWHIGNTLEALGYPLAPLQCASRPGIKDRLLSLAYLPFLDTKFWLKLNTPLGRFARSAELNSKHQSSQPSDDRY